MRILLTAVFLIHFSCKDARPVSLIELTQYPFQESNGLYKRIEKNKTLIEIIYKPSDLILAQKVEESSYTPRQVDSIKKILDEYKYFTVKLSREGKEMTYSFVHDLARLQQAADYLSFSIGKDLKLVQGADTIAITDFVHMRTFSTSATSDVLTAFKYNFKEDPGSIFILFNDNLFNTGINTFEFKVDDLKSIPILDLNRITL